MNTWQRNYLWLHLDEMMDSASGNSSESIQDEYLPFDLTEYPLKYTMPIYGYASPVVIAATVILNSIIMYVMTQKRMRSATTMPLIAIALADLLTGLTRFPFFINHYALGAHAEHPSVFWCYGFEPLVRILPTMFHTASVWLNVLLAIHRYCGLLATQRARACTRSTPMLTTIVCIFMFAMVIHFHRFFSIDVIVIKAPSLITPTVNGTVTYVWTCSRRYSNWVQDSGNLYFNIYYLFRAIFVQIIPCILLIVFNYLLLRIICIGHKERSKLVECKNTVSSKRMRNTQRTTFMLVVVLVCFLLTELPWTILLFIVSIQSIAQHDIISYINQKIAGYILNFMILLNFPCNFLIYCLLSKRFRRASAHFLWYRICPLGCTHAHKICISGYWNRTTHDNKTIIYLRNIT